MKIRSDPVRPSSKKKIVFYGLMLLIIVATVEIASQFIFFVRYGNFVWSDVVRFSVRSFTVRVDDARYVTARPNFSDPFYGGWGVSLDAWGFRSGRYVTDPTCANIVFIGASVPFGWGVPGNASLPSKLFDRLQETGDSRCVINAAIPSYSLFQAVARYEREIHGKIRVDVVFLQIYDPVSQLLLLGSRWNREANWTTEPKLAFDSTLPGVRYSAAIVMLLNGLQGLGWKRQDSPIEVFSPSDQATLQRVRGEIRSELERLRDMVRADGGRQLIVGSLAVPSSSRKSPWFSVGRQIAIDAQNDELRRFTASHSDTVYADTADLLSKYSDSDVFIDSCCHLSERGNDLVAEYIMRLLPPSNSVLGEAYRDPFGKH